MGFVGGGVYTYVVPFAVLSNFSRPLTKVWAVSNPQVSRGVLAARSRDIECVDGLGHHSEISLPVVHSVTVDVIYHETRGCGCDYPVEDSLLPLVSKGGVARLVVAALRPVVFVLRV